jgi:CheY-like chemotaxis protein
MPLRSLRILLVDDYEPLRFLKARLLLKGGAEVLEARDGAQACRILESQPVDLALLDINLPDMPGTEIARIIRECPATSAVRVIFTSASELKQKLEPGELFLQEPIDARTLYDNIRKSVGRC